MGKTNPDWEWIQTHKGGKFNFRKPTPEMIDLESIAQSLSQQVSFNGHYDSTIPHFSVAEHSVNVSKALPLEYAMWGLLHDAAESYIGDIPRPLKLILGKPLQKIEDSILKVVAVKFNLVWPIPDRVKSVDHTMLRIEKHRLFTECPLLDWMDTEFAENENTALFAELTDTRFNFYIARVAKTVFMQRYYEIRDLTSQGVSGQGTLPDPLWKRQEDRVKKLQGVMRYTPSTG